MKKKDIVDTIFTGFSAVKLEGVPEVELLRSGMTKFCLIQDTFFDDLEDKYQLLTGSVLTENMSLVPAYLLCSTRSARIQPSSAHDVFLKRNIENVLKIMGDVMAPGAQGHIVCSDLPIHRCISSLRAAKEEAETVKGDLEGGRGKV